MALVLNDRVKESSSTTGTGTFTLGGAVTGFETFAAGIGGSNTTYYCIFETGTANFEVGFGTLNSGASTLARTYVIILEKNGSSLASLTPQTISKPFEMFDNISFIKEGSSCLSPEITKSLSPTEASIPAFVAI